MKHTHSCPFPEGCTCGATGINALNAKVSKLLLKLRAADAMARAVDSAISCGQLNPRSMIADARLDYGEPGSYEFSKS